MNKTIVFAGDAPSSTLLDRERRGELRRLATGVYTTDVTAVPADVVRREWHTIVGHLYAGAVITDRSGVTGGPVDGYLYLAHSARSRETELPGLIVIARPGAGPLEGDIPLPGGLYQASKGRTLVENTRPSRARNGRPRRTLDADELADWIDRLAMVDDDDKLAAYRIAAERTAQPLGAADDAIATVSRLIGAALGTQQADSGSSALAARQAGLPYDRDRMRLFGVLIDALHASRPQNRPVADPSAARYTHLPFYEAYFSNFIEGTEFDLPDALAVVYEGKSLPGRDDDSHDLLGTYQVVNDRTEMSMVAATPEDFVQLMRSRHATILAGRPALRPGEFKEAANRAGESLFVLPAYVPGTLRAGFERLAELDTAFERAVYMMFLGSEVHPFNDGNGRIARVMMNAELVAGGQSRIIVPTVYRDDYLGALRRLSRQDDASVLIKALRFAQDYTSMVPFVTTGGAETVLRATNAFYDSDSADRLVLPDTARRPVASEHSFPPFEPPPPGHGIGL